MLFQQPSEIPQPEATRPDQKFGEYSLVYFIEDNLWYIVGAALILIIVIGYSQWTRHKKKQEREN